MNTFALLHNGQIVIVSNNFSDGYSVRPLNSTFESATQQNLFSKVLFKDVVVVDTNMAVINQYQKV